MKNKLHYKKYLLLLTILYLILITTLSLISVPNNNNIQWFKHIDKVVHFCFYFGLSILIQTTALFYNKTKVVRDNIMAAMGSIGYGCFIEIVQSEVGRSYEVGDIIANSIGAITAYAIFAKINTDNFFKDNI